MSGMVASPSFAEPFPVFGNLNSNGNLVISGVAKTLDDARVTYDFKGAFDKADTTAVKVGTTQISKISAATPAQKGNFFLRSLRAPLKYDGSYSGAFTLFREGNFAFTINPDSTISATLTDKITGTSRGRGLLDQESGRFTVSFVENSNGNREISGWNGYIDIQLQEKFAYAERLGQFENVRMYKN